MEKSINIFKILFVILIFYILWGISLNFGDIGRLLELGIWLSSFFFIYIPFFLISVLIYKKNPKDSDFKNNEKFESSTDEKFEDYANRRTREIEEALKQYKK